MTTLASSVAACISVHSGQELLHHVAHGAPEVLLLDIDLDGRHGGLKLLLRHRIAQVVPTVLVADRVDAGTLAFTSQVGAVGFLVLPFSQAQFDVTLCIALAGGQQLAAAQRALRRIAHELAQVGAAPATATEPFLRPLPALAELSTREWDVLQGLIHRKRVVELARTLRISPHTVRNHLKSIFTKLDVHSQAELLDKLVDDSTAESRFQGTSPAPGEREAPAGVSGPQVSAGMRGSLRNG